MNLSKMWNKDLTQTSYNAYSQYLKRSGIQGQEQDETVNDDIVQTLVILSCGVLELKLKMKLNFC